MEIFSPPFIKEKRPPGRTPKCSAEYQMVIARSVVEEGITFREAARIYNVSHGAINSYVQKYKQQKINGRRSVRSKERNTEAENYRHEAQLKALKHEIGELYLENLMLKKALKHSVERKSENSSVITSENLDQLREPVK